jgi:hypothetical protein
MLQHRGFQDATALVSAWREAPALHTAGRFFFNSPAEREGRGGRSGHSRSSLARGSSGVLRADHTAYEIPFKLIILLLLRPTPSAAAGCSCCYCVLADGNNTAPDVACVCVLAQWIC